MKKEDFDKLPQELRIKYLEVNTSGLQSAVYARMSILPIVSALSAALLVVATFNEHLIPLNNLSKAIISLLLLSIPLALRVYNYDLKKTQHTYLEILKEISGKPLEGNNDLFNRFARHALDIFINLIMIIILVVIGMIWDIL